jgi:putative transposase
MIDRSHQLAVTRQAQLLKLRRRSVYYQAHPVSAADLAIMRRIDELHLDYPFSRQPDVARPAARRGRGDRPSARHHPDEADGDRGHLPAAEHV